MFRRILSTKRVLTAASILLLAGCRTDQGSPEYVVKLDDQYLTREQVTAALESAPAGVDTTEAQRQIVEQWITNTLLYQEAERRGLRSDPDVKKRLEENEHSIMVSALLTRLYDEVPANPTPAEIQIYYERNKEQLRLREPYVRVRYLATSDMDSARAAQQQLQRLSPATADSVWTTIAARYARDRFGSLELSNHYFPESQLLAPTPEVQAAVAALKNGQVSPVIQVDSLYHVVQLVTRVPVGSIPELQWVEEDLKQRLAVHSRKQIIARQVERLRNEALAREELEVSE